MYGYNLDLGETYYNHVMDHVNTSGDRRQRGETPGPLSYSERIAASRRYCGTDNDRAMRARTEAFEREAMREAIRATSEVRRELSPGPAPATEQQRRQTSRLVDEAHRRADTVIHRHRSMVRDISEDTNRTVRDIKTATQRYEDNISKKMADLRMSPWRGAELEDAHQSEAESRARISGLERELHEVTRTGMAYRPYHKSARELAAEARREDELLNMSTSRRTLASISDRKTRRFLY